VLIKKNTKIQLGNYGNYVIKVTNIPKTPGHLVDDVVIVRSSFVVHAPAARNEFESTFVHQLSNDISGLFSLLLPPYIRNRNTY